MNSSNHIKSKAVTFEEWKKESQKLKNKKLDQWMIWLKKKPSMNPKQEFEVSKIMSRVLIDTIDRGTLDEMKDLIKSPLWRWEAGPIQELISALYERSAKEKDKRWVEWFEQNEAGELGRRVQDHQKKDRYQDDLRWMQSCCHYQWIEGVLSKKESVLQHENFPWNSLDRYWCQINQPGDPVVKSIKMDDVQVKESLDKKKRGVEWDGVRQWMNVRQITSEERLMMATQALENENGTAFFEFLKNEVQFNPNMKPWKQTLTHDELIFGGLKKAINQGELKNCLFWLEINEQAMKSEKTVMKVQGKERIVKALRRSLHHSHFDVIECLFMEHKKHRIAIRAEEWMLLWTHVPFFLQEKLKALLKKEIACDPISNELLSVWNERQSKLSLSEVMVNQSYIKDIVEQVKSRLENEVLHQCLLNGNEKNESHGTSLGLRSKRKL